MKSTLSVITLSVYKYFFLSVIFLLVCVAGSFCEIQARADILELYKTKPTRLKLVSIDNETDKQEFKIFLNFDGANAFVAPQSKFSYAAGKEVDMGPHNLVVVKCCKGAYLPVFIQDGGVASGETEVGFEGPFFVSMWLQHPFVQDSAKIRVRYLLRKGSVGTLGLKIGKQGDYRLIAVDNIKFLP